MEQVEKFTKFIVEKGIGQPRKKKLGIQIYPPYQYSIARQEHLKPSPESINPDNWTPEVEDGRIVRWNSTNVLSALTEVIGSEKKKVPLKLYNTYMGAFRRALKTLNPDKIRKMVRKYHVLIPQWDEIVELPDTVLHDAAYMWTYGVGMDYGSKALDD